MVKRIRFLIVFCSLMILSCTAFAAFEKLYMVDSEGSTTRKENDIFDWDETPWLYIKLDKDNYNIVSSWWYTPTSGAVYYADADPDNVFERWLTLDNWDSVKEVGEWEVNALYYYAFAPCDKFGEGCTRFTVTPEPLGCALFALGGITLALIRKKRKSA